MEKVRAAATVPWQEAVDFAAEAFAATGVPQADARKAGEAHPYVVGNESIQRYVKVAEECARANQLRLK